MKEAVIGQVFFFAASILFGGGLLAVYDIIRGFRRTWIHKSIWVTAEDAAFWLFAAVASFVFLCRYNQGQLRGFFFLGLILGMILYHWKASRYVLGAAVRIFRLIKRIAGRCVSLIRTPAVHAGRNMKWKLKKERESIRMVFKKGGKRGDFHEKKQKEVK